MKYRMDEICDFYNGGAWSDKEYVKNGLPVLKVTNCKPKGFMLDDINYLPYTSAEKYSKNKLKIGDVIIATVGSHPNLVDSSAGRACVVNSLVEGFYLNQNAVCIRSKDNNILDQGYLGYFSKYRVFQHYIQMCGRGAANQMRIAISAIKKFEFDFPNIDKQRKISSILLAYDSLIENNQKQIKLLEEAAERLYKDWFVDLHFFGNESTIITDGIPDGWKIGTVEDIAPFKRGKVITKKDVTSGDIPVVAGGREPAYYCNKYNTSSPVITVSASGNAGFVKLYYEKIWASDCSYLDNDSSEDLFYIYCFLKNKQEDIYNMQKGACQQHVNSKDINSMKLLIPSKQVLSEFRNNVNPIFNKIRILYKQIMLLSKTRDDMLPILMGTETKE